jgi:sulfite dehydrogenase (quinone) subunit SoeC
VHPAASIVVFSALSGLGYGLAVWLALGIPEPASIPGRIGYVLALLLVTAGLVSSTFHLGRPERAWRAVSQWRSSWLSREGLIALLAYVPLGLAAIGAVLFGEDWRLFAVLGAALAVAVVFCTAMIYASLRTVAQWNTWLTPAVYLALSLAGGLVFAVALESLAGPPSAGALLAALVALLLAWGVKALWWWRAARARSASTPESATGLGHLGGVRLFERPHVTENYLTREMGFRIAHKHARKLRRIAVALGLVAPALALLVALFAPGPAAAVLLWLGLLAFAAGTLVERWLFFAEARHSVMLYYGDIAA